MDMELINRGLAVGIPLSGKSTMPEWGISLAIQGWPINTSINWLTTRGVEVAEARTQIVQKALDSRIRYLWFIDEDVAVPHFAISKLMYEMRQRQITDPLVKIVGGIYCAKTTPAQPLVFRGKNSGTFWEWTVGDVFECDGVGAGCMLIDLDLFQAIEKPWFLTLDQIYEDVLMFRPFADKEVTVIKDQGNEDSYFCQKVREAGFKIIAHGGVLCPHWDAKAGVSYVLPIDSYPIQSIKKEVLDTALLAVEVRGGRE